MRSATGRVGGFLRATSMNPVTLPTRASHSDELREFDRPSLCGSMRLRREHASVVARHDLDEQGHALTPCIEQARRMFASGIRDVALDQITNELCLVVGVERLQFHELGIA